tara:strand:- start:1740 stop:1973 length:234 start_codon:yes stop_codon:yes gene_type:complete
MALEQTDRDDGNRPLTPEERKALRRLLEKETDILDVANNFSHLGWAGAAMLKIAKWIAAVIGAVVIWNSYKAGGGIK